MTAPLVAVSSYGPGAASTRARVVEWLSRTGLSHELHDYLGTSDNSLSAIMRRPVRTIQAEATLRALAGRVSESTVLLSRQATPFSSGAIESKLLERAALGVYDFDDALFFDTASLGSRLFSKPSTWKRAVGAADVVIAGSEFLADAASPHSANVRLIPTCVELDQYVVKTDFDVENTPRGVWIGTPSTEQFLTMIADPLLRLHAAFGLRMTLISAGSASHGALDTMIDRVAWTEGGFAGELAQGDFGIMPLPDSPYARGKCAYKLLQYGASALPLVGSPVGANRTALTRLGGDAAESDDDWFDAIAAILGETSAQRSARGAAALAGVTTNYSFQAWQPAWLDALGKG